MPPAQAVALGLNKNDHRQNPAEISTPQPRSASSGSPPHQGTRASALGRPKGSCRAPILPGGQGSSPGEQRVGFYIRFSSFMISHTLIQLDNQREKPTQVFTKWASATPRTREWFGSDAGAPQGGRIHVPSMMKKPQWFGWESRNLLRHLGMQHTTPALPDAHQSSPT